MIKAPNPLWCGDALQLASSDPELKTLSIGSDLVAGGPDFLRLQWTPVDLTDLSKSLNGWRDTACKMVIPCCYFILIQDRDGGDYVVMQSYKPWVAMARIVKGHAGKYLKQKYGAHVAANINVWVSTRLGYDLKAEVENSVLGRWADKKAESARGRSFGKQLMNNPEYLALWEYTAPESFKWLKENNYC